METNEYKISFFKPTTQQAKENRNLIIKLFLIWAVAIFGFQILLKIIEKPVPEKSLLNFREAWEKISSGNATDLEYKTAGQSMLQVMGKSTVNQGDYTALKDGLGWILSNVYPASELNDLQRDIRHLNEVKQQITSLRDEKYLSAKEMIISKAAPALGIDDKTLLAQILAIGLDDDLENISEQNKSKIPDIMSLYLTHNRSILTDTIFLGFPFHYFYSAVFLLVFFIGLCWIYCYKTDKLHARLNFVEQND